MSQPPVTIHVDNDVSLEFAAEIHAEAHHLRHRFRILSIDVENRNLQHFSHVRRVGAGACFAGARRESELVIHHHVQRAAHAVARRAGSG